MIVGLILRKGRGPCRDTVWQSFSLLDLFPVMTDREADDAGCCKGCRWACSGHPVIEPCDGAQHGRWRGGTKLCTIDFRRKYMPSLKLSDLA